MHELLQNAEDAEAKEFYVKFTPEALWIGNSAVFEAEHFQALSAPAAGTKRHDVEKIGSFGIGFTSVYQLTDAPEVMSCGQRHLLLPLTSEVEIVHDVEHEWPTTIRLPWAFKDSEMRRGLESDVIRPEQLAGFMMDARVALTHSAIFLKHVQRLQIFDGEELTEDISVTRRPKRRTVRTLTQAQSYRMYTTTVKTQELQHLIDEEQRKALITFAVPEHLKGDFQGFFFATLPTQERTFAYAG